MLSVESTFWTSLCSGYVPEVNLSTFYGHEKCHFFQADILVMGSDQQEDDSNLLEVLKVLWTNGLTVESSKCKFAQDKVTHLGHIIDKDGIKPKSDLLVAIKNSPSPKCKDDVKAFLGLAEFYAKFVHGFSSKTYPIRLLFKKRAFLFGQICVDKLLLKLKMKFVQRHL